MLRNILFQIHWLIGITAGTVLIVVAGTGALIAFEHEILPAINPRVMRVTPGEAAMPPAALLGKVQAQVDGKSLATLTLSSDPHASTKVLLAPEAGARRGETRYVDPYTGNLLERPRGEGFFRTTTQIHRYLAADDVGKHIVGASTIGLVLLALSGLYLRWPAQARSWRAWLTFSPSLAGRAFWWHLHSILATWVLVLYLFAALTGLYWSYNWYRDGLFRLMGVTPPAPSQAGGPRQGKPEPPDAAELAARFDAAGRAWDVFVKQVSGFETAVIRLPAKAGQPVQVTYLDQNPAHLRATNRMVVDVATGTVTEHERYADKPVGGKIMGSMYALHTGRFFGLPGLVAMVIASLTLMVSGVSGWLLYLERRRRKALRRSRLSARMEMANGR